MLISPQNTTENIEGPASVTVENVENELREIGRKVSEPYGVSIKFARI
ncbi:12974_t:CDS:2 [Cetraspora pellucida]|uniref:12974_t:CDS:1 n=1 Tax=Cetraspora pellucida TaxID=1433469 RepID=A0A9N9CDP4_9GLOM|nr:12974_t:CDS:2 [Cetraspora pellucida]